MPKAPTPSESQLQESIANYLRLCCPDVFFWEIPNSQMFTGVIQKLVGKQRAERIFQRIMGAWVRRGFTRGLPDIELTWGMDGKSMFWELKTEKGKLSAVQDVVHDRLYRCGRVVEVIRSLEDARASIARHNIPTRCS